MSRSPDLDQIDRAARTVRSALAEVGEADAAATISRAVESDDPDPLWLLGVREALVTTRPAWEKLDPEVAERASGSLAEAKRLAIDL